MSSDDLSRIEQKLAGIEGVTLRRDVLLSENTTWRIGGPVALWIDLEAARPHYPNVCRVIETLVESGLPFTVIGGGSNILGSDAGYPGAVIHLTGDSPLCEFLDGKVRVSADLVLSSLVKRSADEGYRDLEFLTGIPGTVGGALAMNAGTGDTWIGSVVESITAIVFEQGGASGDQTSAQLSGHASEQFTAQDSGQTGISDSRPALVSLRGDEVVWDYRSGSLRDRAIILEATLVLKHPEAPAVVIERIRERLALRKAGQPLEYPSAGSVFRNPDGDNAWRLIDAVGLKGKTEGGAQISEMHTNFIINRGDATAADVEALIEEAQRRVFEQYGIRLQKEVRLLGTET